MEENSPDLPLWANDGILWQAFKKGDRVAFEFIYQQHIQHLINYGYKITCNRNLIQDCTQDLFVELWETRENLSNVISIKYYLLKSLRYKILRNLQLENTEGLREAQFETGDDNFEIQMLNDEVTTRQSQQLMKAIGKLPKRQQEAIHLRYYQELTNEEVAHIMGVNYQSACKFIYTGLKTLRDIMHLSSLIPVLFSLFKDF